MSGGNGSEEKGRESKYKEEILFSGEFIAWEGIGGWTQRGGGAYCLLKQKKEKRREKKRKAFTIVLSATNWL